MDPHLKSDAEIARLIRDRDIIAVETLEPK
jgi:hypothetical protein